MERRSSVFLMESFFRCFFLPVSPMAALEEFRCVDGEIENREWRESEARGDMSMGRTRSEFGRVGEGRKRGGGVDGMKSGKVRGGWSEGSFFVGGVRVGKQ